AWITSHNLAVNRRFVSFSGGGSSIFNFVRTSNNVRLHDPSPETTLCVDSTLLFMLAVRASKVPNQAHLSDSSCEAAGERSRGLGVRDVADKPTYRSICRRSRCSITRTRSIWPLAGNRS